MGAKVDHAGISDGGGGDDVPEVPGDDIGREEVNLAGRVAGVARGSDIDGIGAVALAVDGLDLNATETAGDTTDDTAVGAMVLYSSAVAPTA